MTDPNLAQPNPDTLNRPMTTVANAETDARTAPVKVESAFQRFLKSGTARRALATVVGLAVIVLNRKFGLGLDEQDKLEIVGLLGTYVLGSNVKEGLGAKAAPPA